MQGDLNALGELQEEQNEDNDAGCLLRQPIFNKNHGQTGFHGSAMDNVVAIVGVPFSGWNDARFALELECGKILDHAGIAHGVYVVKFESRDAAQKCYRLSGRRFARDSIANPILVIRDLPPSMTHYLNRDSPPPLRYQPWPTHTALPKLKHGWRH